MVDVDVTNEILSLSKEGVIAMKELIKLSGMAIAFTGQPVVRKGKEIWKEALVPKGIVNYRDFERVMQDREPDFQEFEEKVDAALLNEAMKKFNIAGYLDENTDPPKLYYAKDKLLSFNLALKEYEVSLLEKEKAGGQRSEEKEGMTESQVENVRENNRTADELFFTNGEQTPFLYSILGEDKKEKINEAQLRSFQRDGLSASEVKRTLDTQEGPSGKDIRLGNENKSLYQILNKTKLTGDAALDRANIAEKIHAEIPQEENFVSLLNNKAICFLDNENHCVFMDLQNYYLKVDKLADGQKERIQSVLSSVSEQKKHIQMDLDMTLPKDFSAKRKEFIQEMYERCIVSPDKEMREDINAIRNFMVVMEDKKELTWKDMLLWKIAQERQFEYAMVKMDAEQIEGIYAAKCSGVPEAYIENMIRYEFSADQIRGAIDFFNHEKNVSIQDLDAVAHEIGEKQGRIKDALIRGYAENESQKKQSFEEVKEKVAEEKIKFMVLDENGTHKVEEFVFDGKAPDHEDESGNKWFEAYQNPYGDRIFVNEDKSEIKYEVRIDSEPLSAVQKGNLEKQGTFYQDQKGIKYYKNKGNLINENGKSVKQLRKPYAAVQRVQKEAENVARNTKKQTGKDR